MFCKKCGAKIAENAKFCEECGEKVPGESQTAFPDSAVAKTDDMTVWQKIKRALLILTIGIAGVFIVVSIIISVEDSQLFVSDDDYIACAITVVNNQLVSPGSAEYSNEKVVEKDDYGRVLVTLSVDSQNRMGAYLRNNFAVVICDYDPSDDTFSYSRGAVQSWTDQYSFLEDEIIDQVKSASDWGSPIDENE